MSYSVVIVEDEPPARAKLERFIAELEDFRLAGHADSVDTAVAEIGYLSPDVVYLDVQLGARSGFEVVEGLKGITTPLIVFTTAYSEYAVKAFEIQALDYLLKPYDRERFLQSVGRVRAVLADPDRTRICLAGGGRPGIPANKRRTRSSKSLRSGSASTARTRPTLCRKRSRSYGLSR